MSIRQAGRFGGLVLAGFATASVAQDNGPSFTGFGTTGLIEMPTAESADDGAITGTVSYTDSMTRASFNFQLSDRLAGTFRYSVFDIYRAKKLDEAIQTFDRSFDLEYRLRDESTYFPAMAIGMRDFLGTGRLSSEYIVASKSFGPNLIVTGGLGWGRMGTQNGFTNPLGALDPSLETRPLYEERNAGDGLGDEGGTLSVGQWFHGDAAFFGGIEYQINDKLGFKAEYSSIAYEQAPSSVVLPVDTPLNFGISYRSSPGYEWNLNYLYGTQVGISASVLLNPNNRPAMSGSDLAPAPVKVRGANARAATTWDRAAAPEPALQAAMTALLDAEGIRLIALQVSDRQARVRFENDRFRADAQALGRVSRMMSQIMPPSVEAFVLEPVRQGIPLSATTIRRSDLERYENRPGGSDAMFENATIADAGGDAGLVTLPDPTPAWQWGIGPYVALVLFDANQPLQADVGLDFRGRYQITPNLVVNGSVLQSGLGERADGTVGQSSPLWQNVRSDSAKYGRHGGPVLEHLTLSHYGRPAPNLYSRVTIGYLERMFGGVSAEVLWKPVDRRYGIGAELDYVAQRDTDMDFGFGEYDYQVLSGHLSGYYDIGHGFHAQVDAGRYLAGDWGATFTLDREFENGWKVGAYFTLTDMPFDDFGEGSFDKGIRITVPNDYFFGTPSRQGVSTTLASLSRDGGARVNVDDRLYEVVREGHVADLSDGWGRFWR